MQLGFVSAIFPDLNLSQVLDFAHESGFKTMELMCWPMGKADRRYAGVTHLDVANEVAKSITTYLSNSNLVLHLPICWLQQKSDLEEVRTFTVLHPHCWEVNPLPEVHHCSYHIEINPLERGN